MKITQNDKKDIVAALQSGKTTGKELGVTYGVHQSRISQVYKEVTGKRLETDKLSQTDKEAIVTELQAGKVTIEDLARRYGVHRDTIGRYFKRMTGKSLHPRQLSQKTLSQTDKEEIVAAVKSRKFPYVELGRMYGVHPTSIGAIYRQKTGTQLRPRKKLSQRDKETIVAELQAKKATMTALAKRYGVHQVHISFVFKKMTGNALKPQLTQRDKEAIVTALVAGTATKMELTAKYAVSRDTIDRTFKRLVGKPLSVQKKALNNALQNCRYRAWHKEERNMYPVLGLDWFNQQVLIDTNGVPAWHPMTLFVIMGYSGLRDKKRTPEYPDGHKIYAGDIVQFPINLEGKKTEIKDVVAFDQETGLFIVVDLEEDGDPLCFHNYECEVIGTIQENPELLGLELQRIRDLLKEYTFV
jgi:transposase-like protein